MKPTIYAPYISLLALAACNSSAYSPSGGGAPPAGYATYSAQGDSTTIANSLVAYRTALGGALNAPNSPPAASGRREINWDGVGAGFTNVDNFPEDFFNVNSKRGVLFHTAGTGLRVDSTSFATDNAGLGDQFKSFSPKKLFMAVGSNQVEVAFQLAGTTTDGLVNGFGVVFSDVDRLGSTRVDYFDATGARIGSLLAPARMSAQQYSFVGAVFPSPMIARVLITSGEAALSATITDVSAGGTRDLAVMDDFVYGEPQPVQ